MNAPPTDRATQGHRRPGPAEAHARGSEGPDETIVRPAGGRDDAPIDETIVRAPDLSAPGDERPSLQRTLRERLAEGEARAAEPLRIGRFVVLRILGEGGMGVVYSAYDEELERKVAIKLVREAAHDGTEGRPRMLREAQAMARLSHPNVVQVYEVGEHEGQIFIALEFVRGETLAEHLAGAGRPWQEIRDLFVQAGRGLVAAHAAGIVHRDFKPDNVLVGADGRVRVADFGLAGGAPRRGEAAGSAERSHVGASVFDASLTLAGAIMGTPAYMSPEQHTGHATDARSDQFSFCVALWEALYGARPFAGETVEAIADAVLRGRLREPPADRAAPPWLHQALLRGLTVDPEARFASMEALLAELTRDLAAPARSRWLWPAIGLGLAGFTTAAAVLIATREREPTAEELATIERIAGEAVDAGAGGRWVYPRPEEPQRTAILRVVELEAIEGPPGPLADDRAEGLRASFADTLVQLGDRYWDLEGGRPFARDFYAQVLVFEPGHPRARERGGLSPGQLADLYGKATTAGFSAEELAAVEVLDVLREPDVGLRRAGLLALADRTAASSWRRALLLPLLGDPEPEAPPEASGNAGETGAGETGAAETGPPADEPPARPRSPREDGKGGSSPGREDGKGGSSAGREDGKGGSSPGRGDGKAGPGREDGKPPPDDKPPEPTVELEASAEDPAAAAALAQEGRAALRRGELAAAEQLFNRALAASNRSSAALIGLSDVWFDRGDFAKAVGYAERAVKLAPKDADYRLRLGDAYYKVLRYLDAEKQYAVAAELGHPDGPARVAKVRSKLGG